MGRSFFILSLVIVVLLAGCVDVKEESQSTSSSSSPSPQTPTTSESSSSSTLPPTVDVPGTIVIDGNPADWADIPVFIEEGVGDVRTEYGGDPVVEFDVAEIKLARDDSYLYVFVSLARGLKETFTKKGASASVIGIIYLDADNNRATGGQEFFSDVGGLDALISLWSGVTDESTGSSVSGGAYLTDAEGPFSYFIVAYPSLIEAGEEDISMDFSNKMSSKDDPAKIAYAGRSLELRVSLEDAGLDGSYRGPVRAFFSEHGDGSWGAGEDTFTEEVVKPIPVLTQ